VGAIDVATIEVSDRPLHVARYVAHTVAPAPEEDAVRAFAVATLAKGLPTPDAQRSLLLNDILSEVTGMAFVGENGARVAAPLALEKIALPEPRMKDAATPRSPAPPPATRLGALARLLGAVRTLIATLIAKLSHR
jgi:hypothetical protein